MLVSYYERVIQRVITGDEMAQNGFPQMFLIRYLKHLSNRVLKTKAKHDTHAPLFLLFMRFDVCHAYF